MSRFVARATDQPEVFAHGVAILTKALRSKIGEDAGPRNPATLATRLDSLVIDFDETFVEADSEEEWAAVDYKRGFGHAPFVASAD